MPPRRAARRALCMCLLAAALPRRAAADSDAAAPGPGPMPGHGTFTTALAGLDGRPIGETPLNDPQSSVMTQQFLTDVDPDAVCNDGSPAAYYFAPGTGAGAQIWLVYLEGSMFCFSRKSCEERNATLPWFTGSGSWGQQMAQGGIFDPTINALGQPASAFGSVNRIYVKYCSSDLWSGDVAASDATWGFNFRGARIAAAVITSLATSYGMGATPGQRLLFGGCSAGAIGAMNVLDAVAAQAATYGVSTSGFLDAAALVDIYPAAWPWSRDLIPLQTLVSWLVALVQPTFPAACTALYPAGGTTAWKCLWSSYRLPLLTTPFFTNAVQFDDFLIQYSSDNLGPHDAEQTAYMDSFQTAYRALIDELPSGTGVYSPTCLVHCLSGQSTYYDFYITQSEGGQVNMTLSQALDAWFFEAEPTQVVSSCTGWDCTKQCGVASWGAAVPCNMGTQNCEAFSLPTSFPDEPAPAALGTRLVMPGTPAPPGGAYNGPIHTMTPPQRWPTTAAEAAAAAGVPPAPGSVAAVESVLTPRQRGALARLISLGALTGPAGVPTAAVATDAAPTDGGETTDTANTGSLARRLMRRLR